MQINPKASINISKACILIFIGVGVVFMIGCAVSGFFLGREILSGIGSPQINDVGVGSKAPDFSLPTINGERIKLSDFRGYPVLVNFWASWCAPCVAEIPLIQARYIKYYPELVVLAINADEPLESVEDFVSQYELSINVLLDFDAKTQDLYHIQAFPTSIFVDPEGVIRAKMIGELSEDQMDQFIALLGLEK